MHSEYIVLIIHFWRACVKKILAGGRAIQFSSFSGHFREGRDSEIAPTGEGRVAIRRSLLHKRTTGQLNGSVAGGRAI